MVPFHACEVLGFPSSVEYTLCPVTEESCVIPYSGELVMPITVICAPVSGTTSCGSTARTAAHVAICAVNSKTLVRVCTLSANVNLVTRTSMFVIDLSQPIFARKWLWTPIAAFLGDFALSDTTVHHFRIALSSALCQNYISQNRNINYYALFTLLL